MKEQIKKIALKNEISQIGFARAEIFSSLAKILSTEKAVMISDDLQKRINPFLEYEWANTFIVCLTPYFTGEERSEISRYAWGTDYHEVVRERLSPICVYLEKNGYKAEIICDNHNLNDRFLAYKAGLGFFGKNGFLINDEYGSYTFIGSIVTDAQIEADSPLDKSCLGCGMCEKCCPGGALNEGGFKAENCVSYITQKKGELTGLEKEKIRKSGYIWGCDICQEVCPHNKYAKKTNINSFTNDSIRRLFIDENMSNREFKRKYSRRAFSWRGKNVILRNIHILSDRNL